MTLNLTPIDIYFGVFDGQEYSFRLTEAEARAAVESSFRFREPDWSDPDNMYLGNHWAVDDDDRGWKIVKRSIPVLKYQGQFRGAQNEACHVSWQCPACDCWHDEDVEFDAEGPILGRCSWTRKHADGQAIWFLVFWTPGGGEDNLST
ncbi:hypothetical protein [Symmachiella dynata]|uniref:hypothetical protein n=1 Tax=Symmachiella dynata TaxID=2527995 RepID=UPI0030ED0139